MASDITTEIAENEAAYSSLLSKLNQSLFFFENEFDAPMDGFDIATWLAAVPAPTLASVEVPEITAPNRTATVPIVVPPAFVPPETIRALALAGYDSAYLEDLEQELRSQITNVLDDVMPAGLYDSYFRQDRAEKARAVADKIDADLAAQSRRGFPSLPMQALRRMAEVVAEWQKGEYTAQDKASAERLDLAHKAYILSLNKGVDLEALRSRLMNQFVSFYTRHNQTLAAYYRQLVQEKTETAKLALDNANAEMKLAAMNVELQKADNQAELDLPQEIYRRALVRIEQETRLDLDRMTRHHNALKEVTSTYAGWAAGALGQSQSMKVARHDTEESAG
jgi:hypothetical protein